jgi:hypothetical protein
MTSFCKTLSYSDLSKIMLDKLLRKPYRLSRLRHSTFQRIFGRTEKIRGAAPSLRHRLTRSPDPTGARVSRRKAAVQQKKRKCRTQNEKSMDINLKQFEKLGPFEIQGLRRQVGNEVGAGKFPRLSERHGRNEPDAKTASDATLIDVAVLTKPNHSFSPKKATICSKRGSSRSDSQNGESLRMP